MKRFAIHLFSLFFTVTLLFLTDSRVSAQSADNSETETAPVTLEEALERAAREGKKILIDVYAEWCPYCQRMHSTVYTSDEVLAAIRDHFVWVKINVESAELVSYFGNEMSEAQFASALENKSVPTTYFLNQEGAVIGSQPGFIESGIFSTLLNFIGSDAYLSQSFEEYSRR